MGQRFRCKYCDFECQGKFALDTMKIHIPMIHKTQPLVYHVQDQSDWTDNWIEMNCGEESDTVSDNISADSENNAADDSNELSDTNTESGVKIKREPPNDDSPEPSPKKLKTEQFGLSLPVQIKSEPKDGAENEESEFATYADDKPNGDDEKRNSDSNGGTEMYPMLQTMLALKAKNLQDQGRSSSPKSNGTLNLPSTPTQVSQVDSPNSSKAQHSNLLTRLANPSEPQPSNIIKQSPSLVQMLSQSASPAAGPKRSGKIVENMLQSTIQSAIQAEFSSTKTDSYPSPGNSAADMLTRMAAQSDMSKQLAYYPSTFQVVDLKCKICGKICANSHTFQRHKRKHPDFYPPESLKVISNVKLMLKSKTSPLVYPTENKPLESAASKPNAAPLDEAAKVALDKKKEDNDAAFYEMVRNAIGKSPSSSPTAPSDDSQLQDKTRALPTVLAMLGDKPLSYTLLKKPSISFEEMVQNAKQGKSYTYKDFYRSSGKVPSLEVISRLESKLKDESKEKETKSLVNGSPRKEDPEVTDSKEMPPDSTENNTNTKVSFEEMVKTVLKDIPSTPENAKEAIQNESTNESTDTSSQKSNTEPNVSRNFPLMNSILGSPPVIPPSQNQELFDPQPHPLKCKICYKICSNAYTFERHKNVHKKDFTPNISPDVKIRELHNELPEPWRSIFQEAYQNSITENRARDCKICGKLCAQDWIYIRHVKMHVRLLASEEENGPPQIVCELCGRQCRSFVGLKRHWDQAKHGPYPPSFKHMEQAHYEERANQYRNKARRRNNPPKERQPYNGIRCPICGRACRTLEILRRHWIDHQHGNIDRLEKYIAKQVVEATMKEIPIEQEQDALRELAEKFSESTNERPSRGCKYKASYVDDNNFENTDESETEVNENQLSKAEYREYKHTEPPNSNFVFMNNPELEQGIKEEPDVDDEYAEYNKAYQRFYEAAEAETSYSQDEESYDAQKDEHQQGEPEQHQDDAGDLFKTMGETIEKDNSDNPFNFIKNMLGALQNENVSATEKDFSTVKIKQEKSDDDEPEYEAPGTSEPRQSNRFGYNSESPNQSSNDQHDNLSHSEFEAMKIIYGPPVVTGSPRADWKTTDADNSVDNGEEGVETQEETTEDDIDQDSEGEDDNIDPNDGEFVPSAESEGSDIEN